MHFRSVRFHIQLLQMLKCHNTFALQYGGSNYRRGKNNIGTVSFVGFSVVP